MPFTLIKGTFHVRGYSPDGDSVRFRPDDPDLLRRLGGPRAEANNRNHTQLRIEAIDALETHYQPEGGGGVYHQPLELAERSQDELFRFLGISGVVWDGRRNTVIEADDGVRGHVLSRATDKYRRPISFVFPGDRAEDEDGAPVFLDPALLRASWNWRALRQGLAYPTYYSELFEDLRAEATAAVAAARQEELGVWAEDVTTEGFEAGSVAALTEELVILPKLFRRLLTYLVRTGGPEGFKGALEAAREPVLDLRTVNFTHFDTFLEQPGDGARMGLTRRPEELVFDPMRARSRDSLTSVLLGEPVEALPA
jgi:hypothetical protein